MSAAMVPFKGRDMIRTVARMIYVTVLCLMVLFAGALLGTGISAVIYPIEEVRE